MLNRSDGHVLRAVPLTPEAFRPFGDVIDLEPPPAGGRTINDGWARRHDLAAAPDVTAAGGRAALALFRARARTWPLRLSLVERHRLGSQAFVPLGRRRFLVVVAPPGPAPAVNALCAWLVPPGQGVQLAPGTWHHPLLALDEDGDFLVIEREGPAVDCEVHRLVETPVWIEPLPAG